MVERITQLSHNYALDNFFRLRYGVEGANTLMPCEPINDPHLVLGIIDNNNVNPRRLLLLDKDLAPIRVTSPETGKDHALALPGKSAFICFTNEECEEDIVREMVASNLACEPNRRHHLHLATVAKIKTAGWTPFWAPLQLKGNVLHVRMVAQRTIDTLAHPTIDDAQRLAEAFTKVA